MQKRRRFKQTQDLEERLAQAALRYREEAKKLSPGVERERLMRRARQAEAAADISEFLGFRLGDI